jgi:hypothetical protein
MARTKLANAGIEPEVAERLVAAAAEDGQRTCNTCNLSFVRSVLRCSACGASLGPVECGSEPTLDVLPADDAERRPPLS